MNLTGIDHIVLTVEDVEATCAFYSDVLGAEVVTFGGGRKALRFGDGRINLHPAGEEFEPKAARPTPGAGDFCVTTDADIEAVVGDLRDAGVGIVEGPVERAGAVGPVTSVYLRDPDDNLVEVATYHEA
jgi:catechol 2,3-dioxygenase-like lactoylglutathione lyase family enzyme